MNVLVPKLVDSEKLDVVVTSEVFATELVSGKFYEYVNTEASWITQGASDPGVTASAASGSMFVPAGRAVILFGTYGNQVAAIRDTADGEATLTPLEVVGGG